MKEVFLKPCPCCGSPAMLCPEVEFMAPERISTILKDRVYTVRCKDVFGCGLKMSKTINEYEPDCEDRINDLVDQWNRRLEISIEEVKDYCLPRHYLIVAAEFFYKLTRGLTYRLDQLPIEGAAAYTIGETGVLKLCVPDGTISNGRLGRIVIVEEEPSQYVEIYHNDEKGGDD